MFLCLSVVSRTKSNCCLLWRAMASFCSTCLLVCWVLFVVVLVRIEDDTTKFVGCVVLECLACCSLCVVMKKETL